MKTVFRALLLTSVLAFALSGAALAASDKPVEDKPAKTVDRVTVVNVQHEGTDSIGARLGTRLKERFNQSNLFTLSDAEDKDTPRLGLLLTSQPEFPGRPNLASIYSLCWVLDHGKGYLLSLLGREVGTVNSDEIDALVDKVMERTDGIATKYADSLKKK